MVFQHYIWDFDGTLFDSYPHISWAFQKALQSYGLNITIDDIMPWVKLSVMQAVRHYREKYGLDERIAKIYDVCEAEEDAANPVVPYPGIVQTCSEIVAHGGHNYLYTHRGSSAFQYMKQSGLEPLFDGFITSEDKFPSKPAPDAILHLLKQFHMDPSTAVMIGDRDIDVLAGTNAGVHGCLFDPEGYFPTFQAEYTVASMKEFRKALLIK